MKSLLRAFAVVSIMPSHIALAEDMPLNFAPARPQLGFSEHINRSHIPLFNHDAYSFVTAEPAPIKVTSVIQACAADNGLFTFSITITALPDALTSLQDSVDQEALADRMKTFLQSIERAYQTVINEIDGQDLYLWFNNTSEYKDKILNLYDQITIVQKHQTQNEESFALNVSMNATLRQALSPYQNHKCHTI